MPNVAELAELDDEELGTRLTEYRRELLNLRFQLATSQLDDSTRIPAVRKDIARVLTLMREREIALAEGRIPEAPIGRSRRAERRAAARAAAAEESAGELDDTGVVEEGVEDEDAGEGDVVAQGEDEVDEVEGAGEGRAGHDEEDGR